MKKRIRPLVLATGDKQFNYKLRHNKDWYKLHDLFYRNLFDYCMDHSDTGGVFDEQCIFDFQSNLNINFKEYQQIDDVINEMNRYRPVWRKLFDYDIDTGEEYESGYILIEDYYSILCGHGVLDVNKHKSSYEAGIINSYIKHDIPFESIRGLRSYNLERLTKASKDISNSNSKNNNKSDS